MMRYQRTKSSMFLMEILINILLFSILCVCSLQFFMKALHLSEETTTLHHAVTACTSVASVYEAGDASMDSILEAYPHALHTVNKIIIYYDEDFIECQRDDASYYIHVTGNAEVSSKISIEFYANDEVLYGITACHYEPLTPSDLEHLGSKEVSANE